MTLAAPLVPVDARPILERSPANSWMQANQIRDDLYRAMLRASAREGVEPLVLKSAPSVYPPWVRFAAWIPGADRTLTERASLIVRVEPKPYHRFPFERAGHGH
jgi:hypothetical protein